MGLVLLQLGVQLVDLVGQVVAFLLQALGVGLLPFPFPFPSPPRPRPAHVPPRHVNPAAAVDTLYLFSGRLVVILVLVIEEVAVAVAVAGVGTIRLGRASRSGRGSSTWPCKSVVAHVGIAVFFVI